MWPGANWLKSLSDALLADTDIICGEAVGEGGREGGRELCDVLAQSYLHGGVCDVAVFAGGGACLARAGTVYVTNTAAK